MICMYNCLTCVTCHVMNMHVHIHIIMMIPINLQQDTSLDWNMIIISVSTWSTFSIYYFWYYCVEMVNVLCTDMSS